MPGWWTVRGWAGNASGAWMPASWVMPDRLWNWLPDLGAQPLDRKGTGHDAGGTRGGSSGGAHRLDFLGPRVLLGRVAATAARHGQRPRRQDRPDRGRVR